MLGLEDVTLGASSRHAKEANRVVDAHRLERLVFVNNEANKVTNSTTAFISRLSIALVLNSGRHLFPAVFDQGSRPFDDISTLRKNTHKV